MSQYHVFPVSSERTSNRATQVLRHGVRTFGVVQSDGIVTGKFRREELQVLADCCPGTRYSVQQASSPESALQQALAAQAI